MRRWPRLNACSGETNVIYAPCRGVIVAMSYMYVIGPIARQHVHG
jgi:hypothetical protein